MLIREFWLRLCVCSPVPRSTAEERIHLVTVNLFTSRSRKQVYVHSAFDLLSRLFKLKAALSCVWNSNMRRWHLPWTAPIGSQQPHAMTQAWGTVAGKLSGGKGLGGADVSQLNVSQPVAKKANNILTCIVKRTEPSYFWIMLPDPAQICKGHSPWCWGGGFQWRFLPLANHHLQVAEGEGDWAGGTDSAHLRESPSQPHRQGSTAPPALGPPHYHKKPGLAVCGCPQHEAHLGHQRP